MVNVNTHTAAMAAISNEVFTCASSSCDELGELAFYLLALPDVVVPGKPDRRVYEHTEDQPRQRDRTDVQGPGRRHEQEEKREPPDHHRRRCQYRHRKAPLRPDEGGHVQLAEPGLLVDLQRQRAHRSATLHAPAGGGDPHPFLWPGRVVRRTWHRSYEGWDEGGADEDKSAGGLLAPPDKASRSRRSRRCRRLT